MSVGGLILVEPSLAGNIGAALRVAANFGVKRVELVRPAVAVDNPEVLRWACGAEDRIECRHWPSFQEAASSLPHPGRIRFRARSREPPGAGAGRALEDLVKRGLDGVALVFGNETRGLSRDDLDRCDLVIRVPTNPDFPVLNLAQAVAILVSMLHGVERRFRLESS